MNTLKLNKIYNNPLTKEQMREVAGGEEIRTCHCGCCWAGNGGSSIESNSAANWEGNLKSPCLTKAITVGVID